MKKFEKGTISIYSARLMAILVFSLTARDSFTEAMGLCKHSPKHLKAHKTDSSLKDSVETTTADPDEENWTEWNQHLYLLVHTASNWTDAATTCQEKYNGAYLVYIESEAENTFIQSMLNTSETDIWMGITDLDEEGTWKWGNVLVEFFLWSASTGEPNGFTRENCAVKLQSYIEWYDFECYHELNFVCERGSP